MTGIPFELCRHTAGYSGKGSVFVMRADVEPPPDMAAQVFPFVARLKAQRARTSAQRGWEWAVENDQFIYLMDHLAARSREPRESGDTEGECAKMENDGSCGR